MGESRGIPILDIPPQAIVHVLKETTEGVRQYNRAAEQFFEAFSIALLTSQAIPDECVLIQAYCAIYLHTTQASPLDALVPLPEELQEPRPMLHLAAWGKSRNEDRILLPLSGCLHHILAVAPEWIRNGKRWDRDFMVLRSETAICEMDYTGVLPEGKIGGEPIPTSFFLIHDIPTAKQRAQAAVEYLFDKDPSLHRTVSK